MKQVIYGIVILFVSVMLYMIVMTYESKTTKETELHTGLQNAVDSALTEVLENQDYAVNSNEEFAAVVVQHICKNINTGDNTDSNLQLHIEIADIDYKLGLIALNVVEEYTNPNGEIGSVSYARTAILEQETQEPVYSIIYYAKDRNDNWQVFKSYKASFGDDFPIPWAVLDSSGAPLNGSGDVPIYYRDSNAVFRGWVDASGAYGLDGNLTLSSIQKECLAWESTTHTVKDAAMRTYGSVTESVNLPGKGILLNADGSSKYKVDKNYVFYASYANLSDSELADYKRYQQKITDTIINFQKKHESDYATPNGETEFSDINKIEDVVE